MRKSVATTVRMYKWRAEERSRVLAELERLREKLVLAAQQLETELGEPMRARNDAVPAVNDGLVQAVNQRRQRIAQSLADVEAQAEQARKEVAEAFDELKKYEAALANRERLRQQKRPRSETVVSLPVRQRGTGDD